MGSDSIIPSDYADWLVSLKSRITGARQRATVAVKQELVRLYHQIGTEILERQTRQGWGAKVIDRLAADLRGAFPGMKGFSSRNLGVAEYQLVRALPEPLNTNLPTIAEIEAELTDIP